MNVERIRRLADVIEIKHKLFNMGTWASIDNICGTSACMAGFAVAEFHPHLWEDYEDAFRKLTESGEMVPDNGHIEEAAQNLLGLTERQSGCLFDAYSWPLKYKIAYFDAKDSANTKEMAKAAVKYLRAIADGKITL